MTKKNMNRLVNLLKNNTQKEAVYAFLASGQEFTSADAKAASIKDPRRVVNKLRTEHGIPVQTIDRTTRNGVTTRSYTLA